MEAIVAKLDADNSGVLSTEEIKALFSKLSGKYYKRALLAIRLVEESTEESLVGEEGQNDQQA